MTYAELKSLCREYGIEVYEDEPHIFFVGIPSYGDCCHCRLEQLVDTVHEYVRYVNKYRRNAE